MKNFILSYQSEWLKKRRSLASLLVVAGGFFIPIIIFISRLSNAANLPPQYIQPNFWNRLWSQSWEAMCFFLLPMGIIMATALITQLEYKNNTWKQVHTTPQSLTTVFFAKFAVIVTMLLQLFVLFNIGMYLSAVLPALFLKNVPYPTEPIPFWDTLKGNTTFFIECLPIVGLQYLLSLQFKNIFVPLGVGVLLWIASIGAFSWKYNFVMPYIYCGLDFYKSATKGMTPTIRTDIQLLSLLYFVIFTVAAYVLYIFKAEKG